MKQWIVKCQVNMDAQNETYIVVKANTERKAKIKAENECRDKGYFHVSILACKKITED